MCNCQLCKDLRHLTDCGVSEDFLDRYLNEGLDAGYNQAVLDGTWPSSVELLTSALERAINIRSGKNDATTETGKLTKGE
ncbi:hypothetical protein [Pseudomonas phage COT4]|uniref:Uncharacterized protein n=1 Tax=Pseudomonas phage M5.1 TaxID=2873460 RepID=A0AAE8XFL8_9CAUD|nr:hypothetical protein QGX13_gp017 [Pseudomonas phage M5.1]UAV89618.1 hypothetical protein M51_17 [Pseudomonas phage M5.1]UGL61217.1 hypothetical protein [Pseudomonas phage COT4]